MDYIQNTADDQKAMLKAAGLKQVSDLFSAIPADVQLHRPLNLAPKQSEQELLATMQALAAKNASTETHVSFLGGGGYTHFIPAVVEQVAGRGEWVTAYTPYQAEASQGTLQAIFEYQSMVCELTGLDVANASHYDAATALAEAVAMALDHSERNRIAVSASVNPQYREVLRTMFRHLGVQFLDLATFEGATSTSGLKEFASTCAAVVVQNPNYFGILEDLPGIAKAAHEGGAMAICSANPVALGVLESPGAAGFDVVTGDIQPLGIDTGFGGPWCGYIAAKQELIRRLPGRLVGQTTDAEGKRAFCLTLQAREQHIRREKASSNICTNQALMMLRATIALAGHGAAGLRRVATAAVQRAHQLHAELVKIPGVKRPHTSPFFNEFVVQTPVEVAELNRRLFERGFLGGVDMHRTYPDLRNGALFCASERHSADDVRRFAAAVAESVKESAR